MKWVSTADKYPEKTGEYYIKMFHINDPDVTHKETGEYNPKKGWVGFEKGWRLTEWLDENAERFTMPTDDYLISFALLFSDGKIDPERLSDMVGMCTMIIKRLYENGDGFKPSKQEIEDSKDIQ